MEADLLDELENIANNLKHHSNDLLHYENCVDRCLTLSSKGTEDIKFIFQFKPDYLRNGGEAFVYRNGKRLNNEGVPFRHLSNIIVLIMGFMAVKREKPMPYFASNFSANLFAEYVNNHAGTPCIAFI
ncbi:unnamed protein product [Rodentolepis nana]|uniref:HECT domain-containing protein n=1 Tax=Rodentolepis nana TaxID=102285 RepID=A0A0R3TUT0_RODNA|nr:unnamed protein product [Rodentolepis nana]